MSTHCAVTDCLFGLTVVVVVAVGFRVLVLVVAGLIVDGSFIYIMAHFMINFARNQSYNVYTLVAEEGVTVPHTQTHTFTHVYITVMYDQRE